jgi:hypothetical protein
MSQIREPGPILMKSGAETIEIPTFDWHDYSTDWSWFTFHVAGELAAYQAAYHWRHLGHGVRVGETTLWREGKNVWVVFVRKDGQPA